MILYYNLYMYVSTYICITDVHWKSQKHILHLFYRIECHKHIVWNRHVEITVWSIYFEHNFKF